MNANVKFAMLLAAAFLLVACTGCGKTPEAQAVPAGEQPSVKQAPTFTWVNPMRRDLEHRIGQPGTIRALDQPVIRARIPGYVAKWNVDMGDTVKEKQVMAELSVPELVAELAQMEALIKQADAQVKLARAAVPAAEAEHQRFQMQYQRLAKAGKTGLLDKDNVEETQYASAAAKARLEMARADVKVKEAQLEVARKNRDHAQTMLDYATIRAPFKGIVTSRQVDRGDFVQPATGGKGDILFTIARTDIMRITVEVPETDACWVAENMHVLVRIQGREFDAKVSRTSWSLARTARTLQAAIDVDAATNDSLRPNMYAFATITGKRTKVWTVPAAAVVTQGDLMLGYQSFCWLLDNGKARRTPIEVSARDGKWVEVLRKQIVVDGKPAWKELTGQEKVIQGELASLSDGKAVEAAAGEK